MNQIHDLLGSIIIGGIVLLMLVVFNGNVMESAGTQTFRSIVLPRPEIGSSTHFIELPSRVAPFISSGRFQSSTQK